jgi:hypothetical protein
MKMIMGKDNGKILVVERISDLLPLSFSGMDLKEE